jgi:hypothetical protein
MMSLSVFAQWQSVTRPIDFAEINRAALAAFPVVLARLLPGGKRLGAEIVALNPRRADRRPGSFKVNRYTGRWADFATGDKGGDPISLVAFLAHFDMWGEEAAALGWTRRIVRREGGSCLAARRRARWDHRRGSCSVERRRNNRARARKRCRHDHRARRTFGTLPGGSVSTRLWRDNAPKMSVVVRSSARTQQATKQAT